LRNADHLPASSSFSLAIIATSIDDLLHKLQRVSPVLEQQDFKDNFSDPQGIYLRKTTPNHNAIAFLFPGQGSQKINMLKDLALYLPEVRRVFERADAISVETDTQKLSNYIFPPPVFSESEVKDQQNKLTDTAIAQLAVGVADLAMFKLLTSFGIHPDMLAGHSYGEYVALAASGAINEHDLFVISALRGQLMSRCKNGTMAAVMASKEEVEKALLELPEVVLANINSPLQCIISGAKEKIDAATVLLKEKGLDVKPIAVSAAFHSSQMQSIYNDLDNILSKHDFSSPQIAVYSNLTTKKYSESPQEIRKTLLEHTINPVLFMQEIEQMYEDGARIFVEIGPGSTLTNLVGNILQNKPHAAVSTDRNGREGMLQLQHTLAQLTVFGVDFSLQPLFENRYEQLELLQQSIRAQSAPTTKKPIKYLVNSYSIKRVGAEPALPTPTRDTAVRTLPVTTTSKEAVVGAVPTLASRSAGALPTSVIPTEARATSVEAVMLQFQQTMAQMTNNFLQAQQNVMLAYLNNASGATLENTPQISEILGSTLNQFVASSATAGALSSSLPAERSINKSPVVMTADNDQLATTATNESSAVLTNSSSVIAESSRYRRTNKWID
jgi:acyl transferase domain-containing protein